MILAGGSETGFLLPSSGNSVEEVNSGSYDTLYCRGASKSRGGASYFETTQFSSTNNIWLHFDLALVTAASDSSDHAIVTWVDGANVEVYRLCINPLGSGGSIAEVSMQWLSVGVWTDIGTPFNADIQNNELNTVDIHIVSNSSSGSVKVYFAGTERLSGTANLSAIGGIVKCRFYGMTNTVFLGSCRYSQIVVADETTIGMKLMTVYASGAGPDTAWTGAYTDIDEFVYSDGDGLNTITADQVENFAGTLVSAISDSYSIRAVIVTARARKSDSGPTQLQLNLNIGGTNYFSSTKSLDTGFGGPIHVWEQNPATLANWQPSEISSGTTALFKFGVKSIA